MEGDGEEYTFNIVNQEKANSQYNFGKLKFTQTNIPQNHK